MAGREGVTGFSYLLGAHSLRQEIIVQAPGSALRMRAAIFKATFDRSESLRRTVLRYINTALSMTAQTAARNSLPFGRAALRTLAAQRERSHRLEYYADDS
jgi:hypothetical protein